MADITNSPNLDNIKPMLYDMYAAAPVQLRAPYPHAVADTLLINLGVSIAFQDVWQEIIGLPAAADEFQTKMLQMHKMRLVTTFLTQVSDVLAQNVKVSKTVIQHVIRNGYFANTMVDNIAAEFDEHQLNPNPTFGLEVRMNRMLWEELT